MATLKNTVINDTGHLTLPVGTTAQRPASPVTGMWRYNTTDSAEEYYNGNAWRQIVKPDGTSATKAAVNATQLLSYQSTSGYYWIKPPNAPSAYYVYCDLTNYDGGWMLMMNVLGTSNSHVNTNIAITTAVNNNTSVLFDSTASTYRWATTDINYFLQQPGNKVMWIEPKRTTASTTNGSSQQWFLRPGSQATPAWPTALECNNIGTIQASETTAWTWQGYGSFSNARDNVNMIQGNYSSSGHWGPTIFDQGQSFFGNVVSGIRFSVPFNTTSNYTNGNPGYLWLKVY